MSRQAPGGGIFSVEAIFLPFLSSIAAAVAVVFGPCFRGERFHSLIDDATARSRHRGGYDESRHHADHHDMAGIEELPTEKRRSRRKRRRQAAPCFSWCHLGGSTFPSTQTMASTPARLFQPECPVIQPRWASSTSSEKNGFIIPISTAARRCRSCNGSPGRASPCMRALLPGYPASHGCIRLPGDFAKRMFGVTQGNERVIITRQDIAPAPFVPCRSCRFRRSCPSQGRITE